MSDPNVREAIRESLQGSLVMIPWTSERQDYLSKRSKGSGAIHGESEYDLALTFWGSRGDRSWVVTLVRGTVPLQVGR